MTKLLRIYNDPPNPKAVEQVVTCLKGGGIVIFPSDTVYAIGCAAYDKKAVERLRMIDGRKKAHAPMSFICRDLSQVSGLTKPLDQPLFKLLKRAFPGPFTFILQGGSDLPNSFKKRKEVGVRIPDNTIIQAVIEGLGAPMVSRSIKDQDLILEYTTDPELIHEYWQHKVDLVIDGGIGGNVPSTVVDLTQDPPEVLREGLGQLDII